MTDLVKQLEELWLEKPQKMTWAEMQEVTNKAAARIAELEAALKPFDVAYQVYEKSDWPNKDDYLFERLIASCIRVDDLRAASAALLASQEASQEKKDD
jgi:hypothetical protein